MNILVARNEDWGIGYRGTQSIIIPADRRQFRDMTYGSTIVTGRTTLFDFPGGRPLKGRRNIVLSRDTGLFIDGAAVMHSPEELMHDITALSLEPVFVVGGAIVFELLLPYCEYAFVTHIRAAPLSDTFFPNLDKHPNWILEDKGLTNVYKEYTYSFDRYANQSPLTYN